MNGQRPQEIEHIFAAALKLNPADRVQFLSEACSGDEELRKEVESLLAREASDRLLGASALEPATRLLTRSQGTTLENKSIGPYKVEKSLGAGGMGKVYLGRDTRLNRPVAIKLLAFYNAAEQERVRRFRQEALAASALNHPNILTIYEIGDFEGQSFIVSEFVNGETLLKKIQQGPLTVNAALEIAMQVASALAAAHAAGIVHRDIKPENIMLRPDGLVKVLDFGLAKYIQPVDEPREETILKTAPGSVVGTAAYMSPEQARALQIDARADIWSLGVILFEMVSARRPFLGDTSLDVLSAVIERDPPPFSQLGLTVPQSFQRIVLKCLEKDRNRRYQDVNELLTNLRELKRSLEQGIQPDPSAVTATHSLDAAESVAAQTSGNKTGVKVAVRQTTQPTIDERRKHIVAASSIVALLAVAAFAYWSYTHRTPEIKSIAVLPFRNESGSSELDYLSDGMTDSLINSLSQLPQVTVKAHNSVFRYKNSEIDPQRVASELSVEAILNGRVVQRGDDLTFYLWLVDGRNGNQVWGEQYTRTLSDLISLQREIAGDVSRKLHVKLSATTAQRVTKDYTANAEAHRLYLRGRFHMFKLTVPEIEQGITNYQKAIELDPNYALAYVGLSDSYRALVLGNEMRPNEFFTRSKVAAQKALQLDEELAEAHVSLGSTAFWLDRDWTAAENQYRRALELNPNSADAHVFYAHLLSNTGKHNEAIAEIERARELDPLSPFVSSLEGQFLLHAGRSDEALARLKDTFTLAPGFWFPHLFASSAYIEKGMYSEAVSEARRANELSTFQSMSSAFEGYALAKVGKRDEARSVLERLLKLNEERFVPPYHIALVYNALGEREQTFQWLERAFEVGDAKLTFLKVEPKWNNLRGDAKFQDLLKRAGF